MTSNDMAQRLREPFPETEIGKLPRVTCADCRERKCQQHRRNRCDECGSYISSAHIHLAYVGHAEITDRLLAVDPEWTWQPVAWTVDGLPAFDAIGGLWITLCVGDVSRYGYGHADGKTGGDAIKEVIGDALRNAAMRFGVALDLWRRSETPAPVEDEQPQSTHDATALRREIAQLAEDKGWSLESVAADFRDTMSGSEITTATLPVLAEYRSRFQTYPGAGS